jgi:hypothetical protein
MKRDFGELPPIKNYDDPMGGSFDPMGGDYDDE